MTSSLVLASLFAAQFLVDGNLPAGNVVVGKTEGDTVFLSRELRDTTADWFYWAFRVKGAKGRTLKFVFDPKVCWGGPVGVRGPAVTTDGGRTWSYPCDGKSTKNAFSYAFETDDEVRFYETWQYLPPDWESFLAAHAADRGKKFATDVLCASRKGRDVPRARFGRITGTPKYRIFMSSRHHCSEATATPVLEGVAATFLTDDDLGRWLCENVELMLVPFTDYDGVVDGDQGKSRAPHDHNRDYTEFLYPETRAIRDWIASHAGGKLDVFLDVHCPWIRDGSPKDTNEFLYTPWKDPAILPDAAAEKRFSELLERLQCGSMRYRAGDDVMYGEAWNTAKNYNQGRSAVMWACKAVKGLVIARTYEVPFANANGAVVTPETCRDLGRDTAKVFRALFSERAHTARVPSVYEIPAPGAVKPTGWLLDVMRAARDGYTAHMDEVDVQFRRAWAATTQPRGKDVHWWSSPGAWSAEGGAYWFEGLVRMAYQLDDPALKVMVSNRLETVLTKTNPDSWGFLWWMRRDNPEDVKALKGDAFLLANSEKLVDTVGAWYEATGDKRAEKALRTAFTGAAFEIYRPVRGAYEAWRLTGDAEIARLLDGQLGSPKTGDRSPRMGGRYGKMPDRYLDETLWIKYRHEQMLKLPTRHGLGASTGLLSTLRRYQWTGDTNQLAVVRAWCAFLDTHCRLPSGQWVMDEEWGWAGPNRATETCTAVCENAFRTALLAALGEGTWADDVEESVFNVGPNCTTADFALHTYMQQPNRTTACDLSECSHGGDGDDPSGWTAHGRYARKHAPLCCTAGLNRIWPDFVQAMWLKGRDGGVAAALFGPCTFETTVAGGRFAVRETTDYPFADTIRFTVEAAPSADLPFSVRIPRWCAEYEVAVNGIPANIAPVKGFATINRTWRVGDVLTLRVPMTPRYATLRDLNAPARGEAVKTYGYLKLGPLLFAKCLPMKDVNTPLEPDAEPPRLSAKDAAKAEVVRGPMPAHWDWPVDAPVKLRVNDSEGRPMTLVPYGSAKFRISMFPVADSGALSVR